MVSAENNMPAAHYGIKDVWAVNLEEEFKKIRQVVQSYPHVAMVCLVPSQVFSGYSDVMRCLIDMIGHD